VALPAAQRPGVVISPLLARITGRSEGMVTLLNSCGWQAETDGEALPRQYRLTAGQEKGQD
jgi:hypothetical protein